MAVVEEKNDVVIQLPMEKTDVVIKVQDNLKKPLMKVPVDEFQSSENTIKPFIYKVPKFLKDIKPKEYEPQMVSFGPYHHGCEHLFRMEKEKRKVFWHLVKHNVVNYESITSDVWDILEDLYGAYDDLDENWRKNAEKFMDVMIIDACFLLFYFLADEDYRSLITWKSNTNIKRDILLLENQMPFKLLELLYTQLRDKDQNTTLTSLIINNLSFVTQDYGGITGQKHILELYRRLLLFPEKDESYEREENDPTPVEWRPIIPQATELSKMGVKFKRSYTNGLLHVSFDEKQGVLELPHLEVSNYFGTHLSNVMAFEIMCIDVQCAVTSYVRLMKNLIVDDKDVKLLISSEILSKNEIGIGGVVELFDWLAKATIDNQLVTRDITDVCKMLEDYYYFYKPWTKWWVNLKDPRTQKPWVVISIAAASFGFLLQITQTTLQVYEHFRSNH